MEFKVREFLWVQCLMELRGCQCLVEISYNPPRPIGIITPKLQGEKGEKINIHNVVNAEMITEFNQGGYSWIQCLAGLRDC